jgi:hypothetical protein
VFNICPACGLWADAPVVDPERDQVVCPHCAARRAFRRLPLFVITGASGVGKSTAWGYLAPALGDTVCLEADTLWGHVPATAADKYRSYWNVWLSMAAAIHQSGRPVALFGTTVPENVEGCPARPLLRAVHYLALVLEPAELTRRLRERPAWRGCSADAFVDEMVRFDGWLRAHAAETRPPMTRCSTSPGCQSRRWGAWSPSGCGPAGRAGQPGHAAPAAAAGSITAGYQCTAD